jgi:hypothetical protein
MTTYTPKTKPQPAAANTGALPKELNDALAAAERVLGEQDKLHATLQRTHVRIPELLARKMTVQAELGRAEIEGKDTSAIREQRLTVESERLSAVSQRAGSIEALLSQEPELTAARDALVTAKDQYAAGAVAEFRVKYDAAVLALQTAWATGDALASALRFPVEMPLPVKVSGGRRETVSGTAMPVFDPITISRVPGTDLQPVTIDPVAERVGGVLDRLDHAIVFAAGLRETQSRQHTGRIYGDRPVDFTATYRVNTPIRCLFDGLEFAPNTLVDVSLLGPIPLSRHLATKGIRLENGGGLKAVAA